MKIVFVVSVEVNRIEGKFASKDELADQISDAISDAEPSEIQGDDGGSYSVDDWSVERDLDAEKPSKRR